ncbi:MAG: hypothetical protein V3U92_18495 [Cellulophaga sp.]
MNLKISIIILTALLVSCEGKSQSRIVINIPTADTEAEYIWRTIQDIKFFEENNYQISLPKGLFIQKLKGKAKLENLINEDYEQLKEFVKDSVYNKADYQKGNEKIEKELVLINKINQSRYNWNFKEFKTYQVNLTLYGAGGSYNLDQGSILIFTTTKGQFKNYDNPANTIIHEITHIGIEEAIITKNKVPHKLKERIVDTFVFLNFNQYLPHYRIQNMGEIGPDQYIKTKMDLKNLNSFVEIIMKEK